jgi:hypothetical protein
MRFFAWSALYFCDYTCRLQIHNMQVGYQLMERRPPLIERLKARATSVLPDKFATTISKIIEVRSVLAEQRMRGLSWCALTHLLEAEGVSLAQGTLRNYARMIGQAEAVLRDRGNPAPTDAEIHAALHIQNQAPAGPALTRAPPQKPSGLLPHAVPQKTPTRHDLAPQPLAVRPSIILNPDRDL